MRRPDTRVVLTVGLLLLSAVAAGCAGSSAGNVPARHHDAAPFSAPMDYEGGSGSGLWGDTDSGPSGTGLGCLPGRRYTLAVTLRNRSSSKVTITAVGGPQPAPDIIRRVAVQARLAPPQPKGDGIGALGMHGWSAARLVPVAIPPGGRAVLQSNFLMGRCGDLGPHQTLTVDRRIVVSFRAGADAGRQAIAARAARIILTRGPAKQGCAAPKGATRLIAWDVTCAIAERAAIACHRLPHGTWGRCSEPSREWDCTYTDTAKARERCWLPSKRRSIIVGWR